MESSRIPFYKIHYSILAADRFYICDFFVFLQDKSGSNILAKEFRKRNIPQTQCAVAEQTRENFPQARRRFEDDVSGVFALACYPIMPVTPEQALQQRIDIARIALQQCFASIPKYCKEGDTKGADWILLTLAEAFDS
jgi:hypothetical protein